MRNLEAGSLAIDFLIRIGEVEKDVLNGAPSSFDNGADSFLFHLFELVAIDLKVPRKVVFAALQNSARSSCGVASPLQFNAIEEWTVFNVIVRIDIREHQIVRTEFHNLVRARPHGTEILRGITGFLPFVAPHEVNGNQHAV